MSIWMRYIQCTDQGSANGYILLNIFIKVGRDFRGMNLKFADLTQLHRLNYIDDIVKIWNYLKHLRHYIRIEIYLTKIIVNCLKLRISIAQLQKKFIWQTIIILTYGPNCDGTVLKKYHVVLPACHCSQCSDYCIPFRTAHFKRNIDILKYVQKAYKNVLQI